MKIYRRTKASGFTIIETLIAITVLMIAVAGPLSIANKGLLAAQISKDQMIASYLAQESMEKVKNMRDNNLATSVSWVSGFSNCVSGSTVCDVDAVDGIASSVNNSIFPLYQNSAGYYSHNPNVASIPSQFSREFYMDTISSDEYRAHVIVTWNEGTIPNQVELISQITNTLR
jgi:hypothetical protein